MAKTKAKTEKGPYRLNEYQRAAAKAYGGGDYGYLADDPDFQEFVDFDAFLRHLDEGISDGHFRFIMVELAGPDVDDLEEAQRRMSRAADEIADVMDALAKLEAAPAPRR